MNTILAGTWRLRVWRRFNEDGSTSCPFGDNPNGVLLYAADGTMAVQMMTAERPAIDSQDPLGGATEERAAAYSTCLAYFGTYEVKGQVVTHRLDSSLFPNWSGTVQERPFVLVEQELVLKVNNDNGTTTNEIVWTRATPDHSQGELGK